MANFYTEYVRLCLERGKKPTTVAKELGMAGAHVSKWKYGSFPTDPILFKICDYFEVPYDHFGTNPKFRTPSPVYTIPAEPEEDKKETPTEISLSERLPGFDDLSEENKVKAREYVEMLLKIQQT